MKGEKQIIQTVVKNNALLTILSLLIHFKYSLLQVCIFFKRSAQKSRLDYISIRTNELY